MTPDLFWIPGPWTGRLAIAKRPRGGDWLSEEFRSWRAAGIDVVVSLLEPVEANELGLLDEASAAEKAGIRFLSFPVPDLGIPASVESHVHLLLSLRAALDRGDTVAIHCRQGIGRSGMMAVAALMFSGCRVEHSIALVSAARGLTVPETADQRAWLHGLSHSIRGANTSPSALASVTPPFSA